MEGQNKDGGGEDRRRLGLYPNLPKALNRIARGSSETLRSNPQPESRPADGGFSKNVVGLTWQLRTLFEGFGGVEAVKFMDRLGDLSGAEQRAALSLFLRVIDNYVGSGKRFQDQLDHENAAFEESLYRELTAALGISETPSPATATATAAQIDEPAQGESERVLGFRKSSLSVVAGGKSTNSSSLGQNLKRLGVRRLGASAQVHPFPNRLRD